MNMKIKKQVLKKISLLIFEKIPMKQQMLEEKNKSSLLVKPPKKKTRKHK